MTQTFSDSLSEDKGYNRNHRHTVGGLRAYNRGEQPKSYWDKKHLLMSLEMTLDEMCKETSTNTRLNQICSMVGKTKEEIVTFIGSKVKKDDLFNGVLETKGHHYTGNFYRYTYFYGLKEHTDILDYLFKVLAPFRVKIEQPQLFDVDLYKRKGTYNG